MGYQYHYPIRVYIGYKTNRLTNKHFVSAILFIASINTLVQKECTKKVPVIFRQHDTKKDIKNTAKYCLVSAKALVTRRLLATTTKKKEK